MRNRVIAWGTGIVVLLSACVAETVTMPEQEREIYVVDQESVEKINDRLDVIEQKIDELSVNYSNNEISVETVSNTETISENVAYINGFTESEIMLMARVVQAEYGSGEEIDKRLIASVILNRLNSNHPDFKNLTTVEGVVYQKGQFVLAAQETVTLETLNCVYAEVRERTDRRVLWFASGGYPSYGKPLMKVNNHYFTGYEGD